MIKNKVISNAGWIIGSKIVQSLLALVVTMLTARYLGPANFGLINYAASIVTFMAPVMKLGFDSIIVNELINSPDKEGEIMGTSIVFNLITSVLSIAAIFVFVSIANANERDTIIVCMLHSTLLIAEALEMIRYWYQAKLLSKYTSLVSLVAYIVVSAYKIYLLATGKGIYWFAIAVTFDYLIIAIILLWLYSRLAPMRLTFKLSTGINMLKSSRYFIVSSMMVTIFAQSDKVMLKFMIGDSETGIYSAAISGAAITSFIFAAILDSARPALFEMKLKDQASFELNMRRLYAIIIWLSLAQNIVITVFSRQIVSILFGESFAQTSSVLALLVWYTTFSYIGAVRNIWLLAEGKQKHLWVLNLVGASANIIMNCLFIPLWGAMGAALASLLTQIITNVVLGYFIQPIRYNNTLLVESVHPKVFIDIISMLTKRFKS